MATFDRIMTVFGWIFVGAGAVTVAWALLFTRPGMRLGSHGGGRDSLWSGIHAGANRASSGLFILALVTDGTVQLLVFALFLAYYAIRLTMWAISRRPRGPAWRRPA